MNGELARMLMSRLEDRGLDSRLVGYRGDTGDDEWVEEIVIVNPAARERGEVRVGDDGSVTWEYFGSLDEAGRGWHQQNPGCGHERTAGSRRATGPGSAVMSTVRSIRIPVLAGMLPGLLRRCPACGRGAGLAWGG
jgi:hypothetical protein